VNLNRANRISLAHGYQNRYHKVTWSSPNCAFEIALNQEVMRNDTS
jgi:hypothetical protein